MLGSLSSFRLPLLLLGAAIVAGLVIIKARHPSLEDAHIKECRAMYQAAHSAMDSLLVDTYTFVSENPRGVTTCERYRVGGRI
jgi:hypothetical protein